MEGTVNPTAERGDDSREKSSGVGKKDSDKRIIRGTKGTVGQYRSTGR